MAKRHLRWLPVAGGAALVGCSPSSPEAETPVGAPGIPDAMEDTASGSLSAQPVATGDLVSRDWMAGVSERIRASQYVVEAATADELRGFGPGLQLESRWTREGVALKVRDTTDEIGITFLGWGREDAVRPVRPAVPELGGCDGTGAIDIDGACVPRVEYHRDDVIEWWANRPDGLEQAFDLLQPPPGVGWITLDVRIRGGDVRVDPHGETVWIDQDGRSWSYAQLSAFDANGVELPALFEVDGDVVHIRVDDTNAEWPIMVDPLSSTPRQTLTGLNADDAFGFTIARANVNGDAYQDVVVGAVGYDGTLTTDSGRAYLFLGSTSGLPSTASLTYAHPGVAYTDDLFGFAIASGQLNADALDDIVISSPNYGATSYDGAAYVFMGAGTPDATVDATFYGAAGEKFGFALTIGNFNGGGYDEIAVGVPLANRNGGRTDDGGVDVFSDADGNWAAGATQTKLMGDNVNSGYFGASLASTNVGLGGVTLDGDANDDLVVGAPGTGSTTGYVWVLYDDGTLSNLDKSVDKTFTGLSGELIGSSLAVSRLSINDDGATDYPDILVGLPGATYGAAYVYYGNSDSTADVKYVGVSGQDGEFGYAVDFGNVNGDGYDDAIVGSPSGPTAPLEQGRFYVYEGSATPDTTADFSYAFGQSKAWGGDSVLAADIDGDAIDEVLAGGDGWDTSTLTDAGIVVVIGQPPADADKDGYTKATGDCDDTNPAINPAATEDTFGVDKDCDNNLLCYTDADSDGYGVATLVEEKDGDKKCDEPADKVSSNSQDCLDTDNTYNPGVAESFYGVDKDCDGNFACYTDGDKDGYGAKTLTEEADKDKNCDEKADGVANDNTDCSDADATTFPTAPETAYGADKDCDNNVLCYTDGDQDTFGSAVLVEETDGDKNCNESADKVADDSTDCDDAQVTINPNALETVYGADRDCDSNFACYTDNDQDGFGIATLVEETDKDKNCNEPTDKVADDSTDCLDSDKLYNPSAAETTYGLDRDCDGNLTCYVDGDSDKYGGTGLVEETDKDKNCDEFADKVANDNTDCVDSNPAAFPGATEVVGDGIDENCDNGELCYIDKDQDTWGSFSTVAEAGDADLLCETADKEATKSGDCNDNNAGVTNTGTVEVIGNGLDEDCDQFDQCYADVDKDAHAASSKLLVQDKNSDGCKQTQGEGGVAVPTDDCDDTNPLVYTGAADAVGDGIDGDCNSSETCYVDADKDAHVPTSKGTVIESGDLDFTCESGDGEGAAATPADDCDDTSGVRYPGNAEVCGNGIDENCDGVGQGATSDDDKDGLDFAKETTVGSSDCTADADADGLLDGAEFGAGPSAQNTDADALVDVLDADDDNDGVGTKVEGGVTDTDSDGKKNYLDDDDDGDGILSGNEGASASLDSDTDGKLDYVDVDDDGDTIDTKVEGTGDTDGDGKKNYLDVDDDGDGVQTKLEGPSTKDTDLDKTSDYLDVDDDGDGVVTLTEGTGDTDKDSVPDYLDLDDDGDGVNTSVEGTGDQDSDGKKNYLDDDDDGDGVVTKTEGTVDTDTDGVANYLDADDDGDRIPTATEGATADSDKDLTVNYLDADDDGDSVPTVLEDGDKDGNPANDDTDGDNVKNYLDTEDDGDGVNTALEDVDANKTAANDDTDKDGKPNFLDADDDGDGTLSKSEDANKNGNLFDDDADKDGTPDFLDNDDDNDGIPTFSEDVNGNKDATDDDTDGDGIKNYLDTDDDGDAIPTKYERQQFLADGSQPNLCGFVANHLAADSDGDGVDDGAEWEGEEAGVPNGSLDAARDSDGDGCVNALDNDDDNDSIETLFEGGEGPQYDVDGDPAKGCDPAPDGLPNYLDFDSDGDAKDNGTVTKDDKSNGNDGKEIYESDVDQDGVPDILDCLDNDGCDGDPDGDGLTNCEERALGSRGTSKDSDGDGLTDDVEVGTFSNPINHDGDLFWTDTDGNGAVDDGTVWTDTNGDGEIQASEFTGTLWVDTNGDGRMTAGEGEVRPRYDLIDADDDGDNVDTVLELLGVDGTGTPANPGDSDGDATADYLDLDDDGDGVNTADEEPQTRDFDPTNDDSDGDGVADYLDLDSCTDCDGDHIDDREEADCGLDALTVDTDEDGIPDDVEICGTRPGCDLTSGVAGDAACDLPLDADQHDADGVPDVLDNDDDGDGVPTKDETGVDRDEDGLPDNLDTDSDGDGVADGAESRTNDPDCDGTPEALDRDETDGPCAQDPRVGGADTDTGGGPSDETPKVPMCGCASTPTPAVWGLSVLLLGLLARRRR